MKINAVKSTVWVTALIMFVFLTAFWGLQGSQARYNNYEAPALTMDLMITPSLTLPPGCIPFPVATLNQQVRTPTPKRGSRTKVSLLPTEVPYPVTQKIDLSPNVPMEQKSILFVSRCNGQYEQYIAGSEVAIPEALNLQPGDRIIQSIPPAVLIGAKPKKEPTEYKATNTPPPTAYPYP